MNVGDIQVFLRHLGALLAAHQGKKPAAEFDAVCDGLEPFREQTLGRFSRFLQDCAEYQRSGVVPAGGRGARARKPAAPRAAGGRPALKRKDDVQAVEEAAAVLRGLLDRATDPALTHEAIEAEVARIDATFDAEGLKAVARRFGITSGLTGKAATRAKILSRIAERKGRHERGEAIAEVARTATAASPPAPPADGVRSGPQA